MLMEGIAKLAAWAKFDDFFVGSVFRKVTYPIGHRHFAKNPNPTKKARIWARRSFAIPSMAIRPILQLIFALLLLLCVKADAKVYDCFLVFNEWDLLEIRLNELLPLRR